MEVMLTDRVNCDSIRDSQSDMHGKLGAEGMRTILLLVASNVFMTIAWYGHLRFKSAALWKVVLASWLVAFFEYCLQVPANRWGHGQFSASQLKILQEVITLTVFTGFAAVYLREWPRWNLWIAYILIIAAIGFAFLPSLTASQPEPLVTPSVQEQPEPMQDAA